jgi:hypothetical protein
MSTDDIPIILLATIDGLSDEEATQDAPESTLGMVATIRASDVAYGRWNDLVGVHADHQDTIVGVAFPVEQTFRWSRFDTRITTAAGKSTVAGTNLLRRIPNGEIAGSLIDIGDARVGSVTGTFPVRAVWLGACEPDDGLSFEMGSLLQVAVKWALGDYASTTTYSTTLKSALRFPSIDLSPAGTYGSSTIDWTADTPTNTAIVVRTSTDGENFSTATKGAAIPGFSVSDPLTGVRLWVKVELQTSDGVSTPTFSDLIITVVGEGAQVTATPTDYFQQGQVKWTSGANSGLDAVAVGDTFDVYPGCQKRLAEDCITKFNNAENFQGDPYVPGEDVVNRVEDAR